MAQNQKRTQSKSAKKKSRKSKVKKGKAYIPAHKIIISCAVIITVCMALLLVTTLTAQKPSAPQNAPSLSEQISQKTDDSAAAGKTDSPAKPAKNERQKNDKAARPEKKERTEKAEKSGEKKTAEASRQDESGAQAGQSQSSVIAEPEKPAPSAPQKNESKEKEPSQKVVVPQKKQEATARPQKSEEKSDVSAAQRIPDADAKKTDGKYGFPEAKNNAQLIFVFDDGGQNLGHLKPFLQLPFPITVAVLPQIAHSKETASQVRASGNEVILHQPMQAVNESVNPGPGAITPNMDDNQIIFTLFQNITEIGPIAGMNNHEGSAITADAEKMAVIMQVCSREGIFFLDSRTNAQTKVPYVARELGYSYYERNIFLDNEKTAENALSELRRGLEIANNTGCVIMIGHIWSADFLPAFLQSAYPELKEKGYTFSVVSKSQARKF